MVAAVDYVALALGADAGRLPVPSTAVRAALANPHFLLTARMIDRALADAVRERVERGQGDVVVPAALAVVSEQVPGFAAVADWISAATVILPTILPDGAARAITAYHLLASCTPRETWPSWVTPALPLMSLPVCRRPVTDREVFADPIARILGLASADAMADGAEGLRVDRRALRSEFRAFGVPMMHWEWLSALMVYDGAFSASARAGSAALTATNLGTMRRLARDSAIHRAESWVVPATVAAAEGRDKTCAAIIADFDATRDARAEATAAAVAGVVVGDDGDVIWPAP